MVKRLRSTSVTLYGSQRVQCSPECKQALLERLHAKRDERPTWTSEEWKSVVSSIKAMAIWGAMKHGGARRGSKMRPASGGQGVATPQGGLSGKRSQCSSDTVVEKESSEPVASLMSTSPTAAGNVAAAATVRYRLRHKQPPYQVAIGSVVENELASGSSRTPKGQVTGEESISKQQTVELVSDRMQNPLSCEESVSKQQPVELVNDSTQDALSYKESVSKRQPMELVSDSMQDAPSYACTFGHVIKNSIGHGTYGKVFTAQRQNGDKVAIKHIECMPDEMHCAQHEISALQQLQHPSIVSLLEVNKTSFAIDLVLEHCDMTLRDVIKHPAKLALLSSTVASHFALVLFKALTYVHERRWLHRDLKPANILVKFSDSFQAASGAEPRLTSCAVKLADFGMARQLPQDRKPTLTQDMYSLWYRSPEILLGTVRYGYASDVWAMGCVCVEMSEFEPAFADSSEIGVLFKMFKALGSPSRKEWPQVLGLPRYREGLFPNFQGGLGLKWGLRIGPQYNALLQGVLRVTPKSRWSAETSYNACTLWPSLGVAEAS